MTGEKKNGVDGIAFIWVYILSILAVQPHLEDSN